MAEESGAAFAMGVDEQSTATHSCRRRDHRFG